MFLKGRPQESDDPRTTLFEPWQKTTRASTPVPAFQRLGGIALLWPRVTREIDLVQHMSRPPATHLRMAKLRPATTSPSSLGTRPHILEARGKPKELIIRKVHELLSEKCIKACKLGNKSPQESSFRGS